MGGGVVRRAGDVALQFERRAQDHLHGIVAGRARRAADADGVSTRRGAGRRRRLDVGDLPGRQGIDRHADGAARRVEQLDGGPQAGPEAPTVETSAPGTAAPATAGEVAAGSSSPAAALPRTGLDAWLLGLLALGMSSLAGGALLLRRAGS